MSLPRFCYLSINQRESCDIPISRLADLHGWVYAEIAFAVQYDEVLIWKDLSQSGRRGANDLKSGELIEGQLHCASPTPPRIPELSWRWWGFPASYTAADAVARTFDHLVIQRIAPALGQETTDGRRPQEGLCQ